MQVAQGSKGRTPLATITNGSIQSVAGPSAAGNVPQASAAGRRQPCTVAEKATPATRSSPPPTREKRCRAQGSPRHRLHSVRRCWRCECPQEAAIGFGVDLFTRISKQLIFEGCRAWDGGTCGCYNVEHLPKTNCNGGTLASVTCSPWPGTAPKLWLMPD